MCVEHTITVQQLLTTDAQVGGVSDLSINDLIGWSHRNLRRFIGINEHCSFTTVNRWRFCSSWILSAGVCGQWGLFYL